VQLSELEQILEQVLLQVVQVVQVVQAVLSEQKILEVLVLQVA
jgi:hypothetical protein